MKLDELKEHCLKTLKQTEKFPTKTFEEHALVLRLIENQTSVIAELEKIKKEVNNIIYETDYDYSGKHIMNQTKTMVCTIIDKYIAELKGEGNEKSE